MRKNEFKNITYITENFSLLSWNIMNNSGGASERKYVVNSVSESIQPTISASQEVQWVPENTHIHLQLKDNISYSGTREKANLPKHQGIGFDKTKFKEVKVKNTDIWIATSNTQLISRVHIRFFALACHNDSSPLFCVVNFHDYRRGTQTKNVLEMCRSICEACAIPVILTGDFNNDIRNQVLAPNFTDNVQCEIYCGEGALRSKIIDFVVVFNSKQGSSKTTLIKLKSCNIVNVPDVRTISNHDPIYSEFELHIPTKRKRFPLS